MKRQVIAVAGAIVGLFAAACGTGGKAQMGFTLNANNEVVVIYQPCDRNRLIYDVYVEQGAGFSQVVWHISTASGRPLEDLTLGKLPSGDWVEEVPLALTRGERAVVALATEPDGRRLNSVDAEIVDPERLSQGSIWVPPNRTMSASEFAARDSCT